VPAFLRLSTEVIMKKKCWQDVWNRWVVVFSAYQILAVIFTLQRFYFDWRSAKSLSEYTYALAIDHLINSFVWGILTVLILCLTRRFRLDTARRWWNLLAIMGFGIVISVLHLLIYICIYLVTTPLLFPAEFHFSLEGILSLMLKLNPFWRLVHMVPIIILSYAYDFYLLYIQGARKAAELEALLAKAHLQTLQMQLQPHFLFNTLNAIYVLVREDADSACRMLETLSSLLRLTLKQVEQSRITLREELNFLKLYLSIEQVRFHDRLQVEYAIPAEVNEALVPNFILQPLVENAILHGITQSPGAGRLEIRAQREQDRLLLQIKDDGPGMNGAGSNSAGQGIGLSNTRERLRQMFGENQQVELLNLPGGGFTATLKFPYQEAATEMEFVYE
jgi:two-component system, LytTR family, sensor kinase